MEAGSGEREGKTVASCRLQGASHRQKGSGVRLKNKCHIKRNVYNIQ
jgi:hypothetical protein